MSLDLKENYSLEEMDRQSLFHPSTSIADHLRDGPTIIAARPDRNGMAANVAATI